MKSMLLSIAVFGYLQSLTQVQGLFPCFKKQNTESIEDRPFPKYPDEIVKVTLRYKGETPLPEEANDFKSAYLYLATYEYVLNMMNQELEKFKKHYSDLVDDQGEEPEEVKKTWNEEMNLLENLKRSADASYSEIDNLKDTLGRLGPMSKRKIEQLEREHQVQLREIKLGTLKKPVDEKKPGLLKRALRSIRDSKTRSDIVTAVNRWSIKNGDIVETLEEVKLTKPIVNAPKKIKDKKIPKNSPAVATPPKTLTLRGRSSFIELDAFKEGLWELFDTTGDALVNTFAKESVLSTDEKVNKLKRIMWQSDARFKDLGNVKLHLKQIVDFIKEDLETRTTLYKNTYPTVNFVALKKAREEKKRTITVREVETKMYLEKPEEGKTISSTFLKAHGSDGDQSNNSVKE